MNFKKVQQILFSTLVVLSLFSSIYINGEAKELKTQGFDVSYISSEDAEAMLPDVEFISHVMGKIKDAIFFTVITTN